MTTDRKALTAHDIAKMIDHSLLRPDMTDEEVVAGCRLARSYDVASVCVRPCDAAMAGRELAGSDVRLSTVIGFPHGSSTTETKVFEAGQAMDAGCTELDMVLNIGRLVSGNLAYVEHDVRAVVDAAHARGAIVKVILENAYLTDEQKVAACRICDAAGADYVKTSTGYAKSGATIPDLVLMRRSTSDRVRIKAAGGVRTLDAALAVRAAGASRFGATATAEILDEAARREVQGTLREAESAEGA